MNSVSHRIHLFLFEEHSIIVPKIFFEIIQKIPC